MAFSHVHDVAMNNLGLILKKIKNAMDRYKKAR